MPMLFTVQGRTEPTRPFTRSQPANTPIRICKIFNYKVNYLLPEIFQYIFFLFSHRLEYFQPINASIFLTEPVTTLSSVWQESIASAKSGRAPPVITDSAVTVEPAVEKENELIPPTEILSVFEESTDSPTTEAGTTESVTESE